MENKNITEAYIDDVVSISPAGYIEGSLAVFENFDELPVGSFPIRLNVFMMLCCIEGNAELEINLRRFSISKNSIIIAQSRQIVQAVQKNNVKCLAFVVSPDYMEKVAPLKEKLMSLFLRVANNPCFKVEDNEMREMKEFYDLLLKWINMNDNPNKSEIVHGLAYSILFYLGSLITKYISFETRKASRKEEILKDFLSLLNDNYYKEKSVAFYAERLFINPKHLTNVVREMTGRTAGKWIDEYVILEAKMLLKNTNLTVCQIAQKLNFANQSFFGKYFKQHVGVSPAVYRNSAD